MSTSKPMAMVRSTTERSRRILRWFACVFVGALAATAHAAEGEPTEALSGSRLSWVSRCPHSAEWTDDVVAAAVGLSEEGLARVRHARLLDNADICTMPESRLRRAIYRSHTPKPDSPGGWARFRAQQQSDSTGVVRADGLIEALNVRRQILARSGSRTLRLDPDQDARAAGVTRTSWRAIGPGNVGGRIRSIVIHPTVAGLMWAGAVGGGIWKTADDGASWTPVDDFLSNIAVSAMAISPTNPNVMYAATGEGFFNVDALRGAGIFRSIDGGQTWTQLPSTNPLANAAFYYINRLVIHPSNGNVLLAAARGGVYRSTDGGDSWTRTYLGSAADVRFDPNNGDNAIVAPDGSCGPVAYSRDGGQTWRQSSLNTSNLNTACASNFLGRVEVAYARSAANVVYASVSDSNGGLVYRSSDGGATWVAKTRTGPTGHLASQGWYDNAIWVDPTNSSHVIVGGIDLFRTINGGDSWTQISQWFKDDVGSVHADHHAIVAHPGYNGTTNRKVYFGNDGGVYRANDINTVTTTTGWTKLNNGLSVTQFYGGAGHDGTNGRIIGGTQDNGSLRYSGSGTNWLKHYGGDGGYSAIDPQDGNYIYGEYIYLTLHRSTNGGATQSSPIYAGIADADSELTANFIAPFTLDPLNPNTMLAGGRSLWRSRNVKATTPSWSAIYSGATGASLISYIKVAATDSNVIWFGLNNGNVFRTTSGTATSPVWTPITWSGKPARMVLSIHVPSNTPDTAYVSFGGYNTNNLWRTRDSGATWVNIGAALPPSPIRTVTTHPARSDWVYVGTEVGIFTSEDAGQTWTTANDGPATASVEELFWLNRTTLVAATHGRGMFVASVEQTSQSLNVSRSGSGSGSVTSSPAGISCGSTCSASFASGTPVTLTAASVSGSTFAGWSGDCAGTGSCTVTMTAARNVTASFTVTNRVLSLSKAGTGSGTVVSSPAGLQCDASCGTAAASFAIDTTVTLTATPAAGSTFSGWSGACSGTGVCTVTMTAAQSVTAAFATSASAGPTTSFQSTNLSGSSGSLTSYSLAIPAGAVNLVVRLSGGTGDADLLVRAGTAPTASAFDCASYTSTNTEVCTVPRPQAATYYFGINAFSAYSGVTLTISYETPVGLSVQRSGTGSGTVSSTAVSARFAAADAPDGAAGPSIVGGSSAQPGSWPWQVQLTITDASGSGLCGGSILSPRWVVTAAHCIDTDGQTVAASGVRVRAGSTALDSGGVVVTASRVIKHPQYNSRVTGYDSDIALIELSTPLVLGSSIAAVSPMLLADEPTLSPSGALATVTGWGTTSFGGNVSSTLRQTSLPFVTPAACRTSGYGNTITDNMVCAGYIAGGKDSCQGDSGGPLVVSNLRGSYALAGIVSFGNGCADRNFPGVYTRVARYVDWLQANTGLSLTDPLINCGSACAATLGRGAVVTLAATPASGSTFTGWSGACTGTGTCTVTMSESRSVTANFSGANGGGSPAARASIQKVFVAYYGRPADPGGHDFWGEKLDTESGRLDAVIGSFGNSDEFRRRYGGLSNTDLVTRVYQQLFNRDPDPGGRDYYVGELTTGRKTLQGITLDVMFGAQGDDVVRINNKVEAAEYYSSKVRAGCNYGGEAAGVAFLNSVLLDPATLQGAKRQLDQRCGF